MSVADRVIASNIDRAAKLWKLLRFLEYSLVIGTLALLAILVVGLVLDLGVLNRTAAVALVVLAGFVLLLSWLLSALVVTVTPPERSLLAGAIERVDAPLLDRLNTLVHLEESGRMEKLPSLTERLRGQTVEVLRRSPPPAPFSPRPIFGKAALFAATAVVTIWFYWCFDPWRTPGAPTQAEAAAPEAPIDIPPPEADAAEAETVWGEVRISEPGRDLKVNKFETVALQIEAAASRPIEKVEWFTALNGGLETAHALKGHSDPRYVIHRPVLRAADFSLAEWDVLTYYAKATTDDGRSFQSETYFLEIVPLRKELDELPGGTDSPGYELLNELTGMIEEQQEVIRQTHRHRAIPEGETEKRRQHRAELAREERELGRSSRHLGAWSATKLGDEGSAALRQQLSAADKTLEQAALALGADSLEQAQTAERKALADLIAARKALQQAVRTNPRAFAGDTAKRADEESRAEAWERLRADEQQTQQALEFVQKAIAQEEQIQKQARTTNRAQAEKLAEQQRKLAESFAEFTKTRPEPFADFDAERGACTKSMSAAAEQLRAARRQARAEVDRAVGALKTLADRLEEQAHAQKLAEAHQLREMLENKARLFDEVARQPEKFSNEQVQKAAETTQSAAQRLQQLAEQQPTRNDFGQKLRDALDRQNRQRLDGL